VLIFISASACSKKGEESGDVNFGENSSQNEVLNIYFIPKNLGNPYFNALNTGFHEAITELGEGNFKYTLIGPEKPEPTSQIPFIEQAVADEADIIFIAANSSSALNDTFDAVRQKGIRLIIMNQDIPGSESHRDAAILPVDFASIGPAQIELLGSQINYSGKIAILSATADAPDQNTWVEAIKNELQNNAAYAAMELQEVAYGDDQYEKSVSEMERLIAEYPDLKGVIVPTAVGLPAACKVGRDKNVVPNIKITGLGLPSEMAEFINDNTCEAFQLWDPPAEGYLGVYMAWALKNSDFDASPGSTFFAGKLGDFEVMPNGQVYTLKTPMFYDKSNINHYAILF
jgi:rhamnose transport system substrate-binding protein